MTTAIKTGTAAGTQAAGSPGICRYPGCASPARVKDPAAPGPRPGYCEQAVPEDRGDGTAVLVRHTAMTAFRHRQQLAGQPGQDRPVTAAISRAGAIRDDAVAAMSRLGAQLPAVLDQLAALGGQLAAAGDPEAAEAQAEAVRAEAAAQVGQARAETASQAVARHAAELDAAEARAAAAQAITAMEAEAAGALMTMSSARNGNPSHRALSSTRVRYRTRSLTTPPCYLPRIQAMAAAPSLPHDIYESIQCAAVATASLRLVLLLHRRRTCMPVRRLVNRPGPSRPAACEDSRTPGKPNRNRSTRLWLEARPRRTHLLSPGPPLVPDAGGARERHRQSASADHGSTEADAAARQEPRNSCPPQCYAPGRECADPKSMPQKC